MARCLNMWLPVLHGAAAKRIRPISKQALRARRLRGPLLVALAGAACCSVDAQAADISVARASHASSVIMMVGGMASTDNAVAPAMLATSEQPDADPDDSKSISVVIQPGYSQPISAGPRASASVASRVMALSPLINEAARAADLDGALLMAVIDVESGGNPQAVSPKGATGLMQLMPGTGARHGASDLFDPRQNISAGARYLKQLIHQFGDLPLVLAAYNAGEGAIQKYGGQIPPYAETMRYVPKVIARYRRYRDAMSSTSIVSTQESSDSTRGSSLLVRSGTGD